jgi:hypothetical protein
MKENLTIKIDRDPPICKYGLVSMVHGTISDGAHLLSTYFKLEATDLEIRDYLQEAWAGNIQPKRN